MSGIAVSRSDFTRVVVSIDPAVTAGEDSDDTGIIVVARGPHQPETCKIPSCPGHGYVLGDATCHVIPAEWAKIAVGVYDEWEADRIVGEVNNGGLMIGETIHAVRLGVPYTEVHASRGKKTRAEPVSSLYEQGRVHHIGTFPELEEEMETWTQDANWSPNRLDALVWGLTHLGLVGAQGAAFMQAMEQELAERPAQRSQTERGHLPVLDDNDESSYLKPGCKHRWKEGKCVLCGGDKPT